VADFAQQFVGVNTVIYSAPTILADTGLSNSESLANTVGTHELGAGILPLGCSVVFLVVIPDD
jgi:hypothetical protein